MRKDELVEAISSATGQTKASVEKGLKAYYEALRHEIKQIGKLHLHELGTFTVKTRVARKGRNPATGEEIDIPEKRVVAFKPAKSLNDLVN